MNKILKIGLLELANLAIFILGGTSGLIHPMCYAYVGALLPLLFALVYLPLLLYFDVLFIQFLDTKQLDIELYRRIRIHRHLNLWFTTHAFISNCSVC